MEAFKLTFTIPGSDIWEKVGDGLRIIFNGDTLSCKVLCDFSCEPLTLESNANPGDTAEIIFMPHRIELWVNGKLTDEEWPAGKLLYTQGDCSKTNIKITETPFNPITEELPTVISGFENAEGWLPGGGVFVGDCMPYTDDNRYHVLYLKDRHHHNSKWGLGAHQWEHISTPDFKHWDIHPMAVSIDDPAQGSICTGSHIRKGNMHYLYYTVRMSDKSAAPICRSVSHDGYHFEKDKGFAFSLSSKYDGVNARDPKLFCDNEGVYHMLLTTRLTEENRGCLAHLVSCDMDNWTELENPIYISHDDTEPECPDYIEYGGYYYLIYSLHGKAYYMYSKNPFDGWITPDEPLVPCSSVPKGAIWNEKIVFTGFKRIDGYAGSLTFKTASNSENGELVFE